MNVLIERFRLSGHTTGLIYQFIVESFMILAKFGFSSK